MNRFLEATLRYGLILLLVWTPLAFGSTLAWAYALLQMHVCGLVAIWMLQRLLAQLRLVSTSHDPFTIVWTPLALPLLLFAALLIFQILPLSLSALSFLSPATADLYRPLLPIWPDLHAPLSLWPYATRTALGLVLAYAGLFFLIINTLRTPRALRAAFWAIVAAATVISFLGIVQRLTGTTSIYWFREATHASFFGPYFNRNHFAGYLAMAIPLGLGLLLTQPTHAVSDITSVWRRRLYRIFGLLSPSRMLLLGALAIMTGALFLSTSRGGTLSFVLGLLLLARMLRTRKSGLDRRVMLSITALVMVGMVLWLGVTPLLKRFEQLTTGQSTLTWAGRLPAYKAAWEMSHDFPWFGVGFDAFRAVGPRYQEPILTEDSLEPLLDAQNPLDPPLDIKNNRFFNVHNDFLQLLAETGWIGFGLLLVGLGLLLREIIQRWQPRQDPFVRIMTAVGLTSLFAIGLHSLVDFNLHIPANALLCTTILALTYAGVTLPRRGAPPSVTDPIVARLRSRRTWRGRYAALSALTLIIALGLAFNALKVAIAAAYYPQEEILQPSHWIYQAEPVARRDRLQKAMHWTPQNPWYVNRLAAWESEVAWALLAALESPAAWDLMETSALTPAVRRQASLHLQQAVTLYEQAVRQQPAEPYTQISWLQTAQDLTFLNPQSMSQLTKTLPALYTHVASLAPASADIHYLLGELALMLGDDGSTQLTPLTFFRQALRLDAAYDQATLQAYLNVLPEAEAVRQFTRAIPNTPESYLRAARLLESSHWLQARLYYRTAIIFSQDDPEMLPKMLQTYGWALQRQQDYVTARTIWERLITLWPDDEKIYLTLANTLYHLEDYAGAAQILKQLATRFPREIDYLAQLGNAYVRAGEPIAAEATWRRISQLRPYSANGYVGLAQVYEAREDLSNALRMMQRAVSIAPQNVTYHLTLARLLERNGNRNRAKVVYQRLADQDTTDPHVFYKLGEYAWQDRKRQQAIPYFRHAVRLQPDHAGYRQTLQRAEALMQKVAEQSQRVNE